MTDTVAGVLAEMRASVVSSAFPEARLWADRLAAAHEREVGELRADIARLDAECRQHLLQALSNGQEANFADALLREVADEQTEEPAPGSLRARIDTHLGAPR